MTMNRPLSAWCAAIGIAVLSQTAGAGIASAQPDLSPLLNTPCTYTQVNAALAAEAPDLANELADYPMAQARLQKFLAAPVDQRQQMIAQALSAHPQWQTTIDQKVGTPQGQQDAALLRQLASTCNNY